MMSSAFFIFASLLVSAAPENVSALENLRQDFENPPFSCQSRPLWFWNAPVNAADTKAIMTGAKDVGYCGFGILPAEKCQPFMSPEYLDEYVTALDTAQALGMKMCLYDEYWFPSGSAGGQLAKQHPESLSKRLDKIECEVTGPKHFSKAIPKGVLMGVAAMNTATFARVDLSGNVRNDVLEWDAPDGTWTVMMFSCVTDGGAGLVDYLSPEAVAQFAALTYQKYFDRFPGHFGTTIDSAFYDEPAMYHVEGGRAWTESFNKKFEARYGFSPVPYYPALWSDIGPDTAAARNALFGFRAELFATGFPKVLNEWCNAHDIQLTGHVDQEEIVNPTGLCGDLLKCFEYQDMPGIDEIFEYGRASKAYKVVSSAAYNYDKRLVMTETYGAMKAMPVEMLYKEAMDQFAKGINLMIPHAVWYDAKHIIFEPELSHRTEPYAAALPEYNKYIGRLQRILQHGRHVADIAILYPIATLQAGYYFGVGEPYKGGIVPEEADYMDIGEYLALNVRHDFTFVHPEVLDTKCAVEGPRIKLSNSDNPEEFRVLVMPGAKVIHASNLKVIKRFYDAGGKIVATTQLPFKSAEFGKDAEVQKTVQDIFGVNPSVENSNPDAEVKTENAAGGKAIFIKKPTAEKLQAALDPLLPAWDVQFATLPAVAKGNLTYIHKVIDQQQVYFFANSSETRCNTQVQLRGNLDLEMWDPHTGRIGACEQIHANSSGEDKTTVRLDLAPVRSAFLVSKKP